MKNEKFINNKEQKQYELHIDDQISTIKYIINSSGVVYLTHTEVPEELEGQGVGSRFVKMTLEDIKSNNGKVYPQCPFIRHYINKHQEWMSLLQ